MRLNYLIIIVVILEIILMVKLHELLGLKDLIILNVISTIFGLFIAWLLYPAHEKNKAISRLGSGFQKRLKKNKISEKDEKKFKLLFLRGVYIVACVLILTPGIITDVLGIILFIPLVGKIISNRYGGIIFEMYISKYGADENSNT